jgi:hypothetical protein
MKVQIVVSITLLVVGISSAPARVHADTENIRGLVWAHWQDDTAARPDRHPLTLVAALGPSDLDCPKCDTETRDPSRVFKQQPTDIGWSEPLGLRFALRW